MFSLLRAELPGGAPVYLIDCPALYARTSLYTSEPDEHLRFLALTRAAIDRCQRLGWAPQILHCNDWHTAFAPLLLRTASPLGPLFAGTRTVLTIHNIGYQGIFPAAAVADLGLRRAAATCCTRTTCAPAASTRCATASCTRTPSPP